MKRIKLEEIKNSIQNYMMQRNIRAKPCDKLSPNETNNTNDQPSIIGLNDLALIESSINDYYSYSSVVNTSNSTSDYLNQFNKLKKFITSTIMKDDDQLEQVVLPLFVYMCIELVQTGFSIQKIVEDFKKEKRDICQQQVAILDDLIRFDSSKQLETCELLNNLVENKYRINLSYKNWKRLLNFICIERFGLFLRIINLNLQIVVYDENAEEILDLNREFLKSKQKYSQQTQQPENMEFSNLNGKNAINLNTLKECIENLRHEPTNLNGACCYFVNDLKNCVTSSSLSPDCRLVSFTNENSSIFLYKLYENEYKSKTVELESNDYFTELIGGHSGAVLKTKFTHDSKYMLSCGDDGLACLWSMKNIDDFPQQSSDSALVCSYSGHLYSTWDVEVFSHLNLFSTCSRDCTARLWSFDNLYPLRVYCGHQSDVNCVKFHPNGSYLATGSSDKTVRLWSVQTSEFLRLFSGHRSRVFCVAFSPDGNYLASAGEDRKIKLWDLRTSSLYKEFKAHTDFVHALAFDNSSEILCSSGLDSTVKFWDIHSKNIALTPYAQSKSTELNTDLIRSINVDFSVYSIDCDIQNVFYLSGARKSQKCGENSLSTTPKIPTSDFKFKPK